MSTKEVEEWKKVRQAALESLEKRLAERKEAVKETEREIEELFGGESGGKKNRKKGSYRMTPEHKKAIQEGKKKRRKEKEKLA
jgi:hypothetical protein